MALWMNSIGLALAQPIAVDEDLICEKVSDAQEIVRRLKDYEILKEINQLKDQRIANLEKEISLLRQEVELKNQILVIKDLEIQIQQRTIQDLKDLSDRAIKLAEISKPKSNWQLMGLAGLTLLLIGMLIK